MKVILQQDVKGQGKKGQMIEASDGYARNFLLPRKLAVPATAENVNTMKMQEKAKKAQEAAEKAEAEALSKKLEGLIVGLSVLLGIGLSIFLFLVLPTFLTGGLLHFFPDFPMWGRNLIEGVLKVAIFLLYLIFCSKQKDIYRVFQYHGAEHKTIFCYEAGLPLTVENVRIQPRHHPRCGTSFLFVVIFVSILVSSVVFGIWPITNVWLRTLAHLCLLYTSDAADE